MRSVTIKLSGLIFASTAMVLGLVSADSSYKNVESVANAGALVTWTNQVLSLITVLIGLVVVGILIVYCFLAEQNNNSISDAGSQKLRAVARLATLWTFCLLIQSITTLATVLGTNFSQTFAPGVIGTYIWDLTPSRSLLISSAFAVAVAVFARVSRSLNSAAGLTAISLAAVSYPLLNSHSVSLGNHSLAITASVTHGIAISIWVGTLLALYPFIKSGDSEVVKRFSALASGCVAALLVSGIISAATRMENVHDLVSTGYGYLVFAKCILFLIIAYCAIRARKFLADSKSAAIFVLWELTTMALAVGVGVALHFTPPTRRLRPGNSAAEDILGFNFPPAPSFRNYVFGWYPDWLILLIALTVASLYILGLIRLRRNSISWPALRTLSFFAGISILIWISSAGIAKYAMISFSAHMIQHMVLAMIVPIFLVLGAPITLALRALPSDSEPNRRNTRVWITSLLHSKYSQVVTNPILVLVIFTASLYGIYFTSLFASMMTSHIGHIIMELHFLITGVLFSFLVIGVDPAPRRLPHWAKLLLVLVALSVHAFFALAIMQSPTPIGSSWYSQVQPPWLINQLDATYTGGGIAWAIGEIPTLLLLIIVAAQWSRDDARTARQVDRAADRNDDALLKEYNDRLAKLNDQDN